MPLTIDDGARVRVIRAILGITQIEMGKIIGVSKLTISSWERGINTPRGNVRAKLAALCQQHRISFLPSGMPVPFDDCLQFKEKDHANGKGTTSTVQH